MGILRKVLTGGAAVAWSILLVGFGFLICALPPLTRVLANATVDVAVSPFSRAELVEVASASRDFSFGSHDVEALQRAIYAANVQLQQEAAASGRTLPPGAPRLNAATDPHDAEQVARELSTASEMYTFSADTISHLDDCNAIARVAYPLLAVLLALEIAGLLYCRAHGQWRLVGTVLVVGAAVVLVVFGALGIFALVNFEAFFTFFHGIFFSQGNWQFPYDSLLICSLPTPFWAGMGAVWLGATAGASVVSIVVGRRLRRLQGPAESR